MNAQRRAISFEVCMFSSKAGGVLLYIISSKGKVRQFLPRCGEHFPLKRLCMYSRQFWVRYISWRCLFCHSFPLQRPLCGDHNFFKINSKIKGKCSLNARFFKLKLRRIPLIKLWENGLRTMLKGRAFK